MGFPEEMRSEVGTQSWDPWWQQQQQWAACMLPGIQRQRSTPNCELLVIMASGHASSQGVRAVVGAQSQGPWEFGSEMCELPASGGEGSEPGCGHGPSGETAETGLTCVCE